MRRNEGRISSLLISLLLAGPFLLPRAALAQTQTTGSIAGRLTDIGGAVITGASVALTSRATGAQTTATTDQTGNYRFNLLPPGAYALRFSANGFKTGVPEDITVTVTETSTVNLALSPGQQQETVQVMATAAALQTENATLGTTVEGSTIQTLPLTERNYTQILTLSPGVAGNVNDASQLGRGTIDVYVNGASNISNNFAMDGADINNFGSGRGGDFVQQGGIPIPNPDAIEEFKIQTTMYDAGFGRDAGANVEVITKTGSNEFHGSAWEFFRNNKLNANDAFLIAQGLPRPDMKQNQFGGAIGGPILRDRFFFFGSYQGTRQINGLSSNSFSSNTLPALTNDRSAAAIGSVFCNQPTAYGGTQVACNGANINPVSLALLSLKNSTGGYLIPTPNTTTADTAFGFSSYSIPGQFTEDHALVNTDYQISDKHRLSQRFFYFPRPAESSVQQLQSWVPTGLCAEHAVHQRCGVAQTYLHLDPQFSE